MDEWVFIICCSFIAIFQNKYISFFSLAFCQICACADEISKLVSFCGMHRCHLNNSAIMLLNIFPFKCSNCSNCSTGIASLHAAQICDGAACCL